MNRDVALTFDFDAMSLWIGSFGATSAGQVSRGEFGRVGVARLLDLLGRHEVPATFFVPGHTALAFPDSVRQIVAGGHEVGHHGYVHERIGKPGPQARGRDPRTWLRGDRLARRADPARLSVPSWEFTEATPELLQRFGFLYDSSLMATDFSFYWPRAGDRAPADGPYEFGVEVPVVEAPVSWLLDDFPHFEYIPRGAGPANLKSPDEVFDIWWPELEFFSTLEGADCFTLTMHPQVIGRGSRLAMLDRFITAVKAKGDLHFTTLGDATERWKRGQDVVPKGVPHD